MGFHLQMLIIMHNCDLVSMSQKRSHSIYLSKKSYPDSTISKTRYDVMLMTKLKVTPFEQMYIMFYTVQCQVLIFIVNHTLVKAKKNNSIFFAIPIRLCYVNILFADVILCEEHD